MGKHQLVEMGELLVAERERMGFIWIGSTPNKGSDATMWARDGRLGWLWVIALDKKWRPMRRRTGKLARQTPSPRRRACPRGGSVIRPLGFRVDSRRQT